MRTKIQSRQAAKRAPKKKDSEQESSEASLNDTPSEMTGDKSSKAMGRNDRRKQRAKQVSEGSELASGSVTAKSSQSKSRQLRISVDKKALDVQLPQKRSRPVIATPTNSDSSYPNKKQLLVGKKTPTTADASQSCPPSQT